MTTIRSTATPEKRHAWVKRTTAESTLLPDPDRAVPQLLRNLGRDTLRRELEAWLKANELAAAMIKRTGLKPE